MLRVMGRRNPDPIDLLAVVGLGGAAVYIAYHVWQVGQQAPASGSTSAGSQVPSDVSAQMFAAWKAAGSPIDQQGWIAATSPAVPYLGVSQLQTLYTWIVGSHLASGAANTWPSDQQVHDEIVNLVGGT